MKIKCGHCNGTGKRILARVYADTLKLLDRTGETWAAALAVMAGCKPTAMNNRLTVLEKFGLAKSRVQGRKRFFRVV